ncbi:MAG TPA: DNA polymerase III subunit delta [Casimicrobiaceae bacterium]|jgi:DNA polymerase-3 subunit delta
MQIRPDDLARHLSRKLGPLYLVHGDEPLLALEAGDQIRAAARHAGSEEREVLVVDQGFRWDAFVAANANLGLFGSRKLVDLRIPSGKPGVEGAKALESYAANPNPDNITLITLPKIDRATQSSAWFSALSESAATVAVQPIEREALPRWIAARLARQNQRAGADVLTYIAERSEGNLLAARQEIEKLALVLPEGELRLEDIERATTDVARYDVFQASEAWLAGDAARTVRILNALQAEGEAITLAVWQLTEDLRAIASAQGALRQRVGIAAALRNARVWGRRQTALESALKRIAPRQLGEMVTTAARVDALAKGLIEGSAWDALTALALAVAGKPIAEPLPAAIGAF